jgi:hypothetical protein
MQARRSFGLILLLADAVCRGARPSRRRQKHVAPQGERFGLRRLHHLRSRLEGLLVSAAILSLAGVLVACAGGSGSSGFEAASENAAIRQALDEQRCVAHGRLSICPADESGAVASPTATATFMPTPTATVESTPPVASATPTFPATASPTVPSNPTATPTPTATPAAPGVDTTLDRNAVAPCVEGPVAGQCGLVFAFAPVGFPPTAVFRVAERRDSTGRWTIGPALSATGSPDAPMFDVSVAVPVTAPAVNPTVQLAVLVFVDADTVVPSMVAELADSGASFAFVTGEITLEPTAEPLRSSP